MKITKIFWLTTCTMYALAFFFAPIGWLSNFNLDVWIVYTSLYITGILLIGVAGYRKFRRQDKIEEEERENLWMSENSSKTTGI